MKDFELRLVSPSFDDPVTDDVMELNHLRRLQLAGTTAPWMFFQLKTIFHMMESIGSARIEGNRTTISEYVEQKLAQRERSDERFSEIANVERAMAFIEDEMREGTPITHHFVHQLHQLVVSELDGEGDRTPGAYRTWNVNIAGSAHVPPDACHVRAMMDELLAFVNEQGPERYELLRTALAHHRFVWIHPFGNGNGRAVRLLTYALLIKYGFNVKDGKLLNPTAVFCNDRDAYYAELARADAGTDAALLGWCRYVLHGVREEITKVNHLLDFDFLHQKVLLPTLQRAIEREYITTDEAKALRVGVKKQQFKSADLEDALGGLSDRQRTALIARMKEQGFIRPLKDGGRIYHVSFMNNYLMRCLVQVLESEGFIPPIDR
ncbi:MAG TPA: Fic family protein [Rhodanobacteraceae bacterium]